METYVWLILICAVFVGSYVQSLIGFAMGLIVVGIGSISGSVDFGVLTAAVSLITLFNIVVSLKGHLPKIHGKMLFYMVFGQLPCIALGLFLVNHLAVRTVASLELLLGMFLLISGSIMVFKPQPRARLSSIPGLVLGGAGGGLTGGLFAASGPVIGWFGYRQPLELNVIRATILCFFLIACVCRTTLVGIHGGLTREVWSLVGVSIPITLIGAWLGTVAKPKLSDAGFKRWVFTLLILMGIYISFRALASLV
ncbi:MAG: TSUP family transporter [Gammaproteobacteria bacterium]